MDVFLSLFAMISTLASISCNITSNAIVSLMQKYSSSSEFITDSQFQQFLNKIYRCNKTDYVPQSKQLKHCLSAEETFRQLNIENGILDITGFMLLCPVVLESMENGFCSSDQLYIIYNSSENTGKPLAIEVWGYGFLFVTVIVNCSLIGVIVLPLMNKEFYNQLLMALIGLAVGSLSSSAIFHLIPQAYGIADDNEHGYLSHSFMMVAGIWIFFLVERIMNTMTILRSKKSPYRLADIKEPSINVVSNSSDPVSDPYESEHVNGCLKHEELPSNHGHSHVVDTKDGRKNRVAPVAYMIIFGDAFHNFVDGLSIGAAFNENILTGISISLAVLCEELPHELGDMAVLLNSGMKMKKALICNFWSACTCYIGLALGIWLGEFEASTYIFGFAAGMFLYISLVDMMPKMDEMAEHACHVSVEKAVYALLLQNLGLAVGVVSLYILARYQSCINFT